MVSLIDESFNWPSVPEFSFFSSHIAFLSVSLSNVNTLDTKSHHESAPFGSSFWLLLKEVSCIFDEIEKCLFYKPADHSGIGSTAGNCSGFPVVLVNFFKKSLSHAIVRALWKFLFSVGIMTSPFFFDCVNVENSFFLTILDDIAGRSATWEIYKEANFINKHFI